MAERLITPFHPPCTEFRTRLYLWRSNEYALQVPQRVSVHRPGVPNLGTPLGTPLIAAGKSVDPSRKNRNHPSAQEKYMAHTHGNEYQVVIVHQDGTEELSGWMNSDEQVAQTMAAAAPRTHIDAYWLRERNVLCPECLDKAQEIVFECPITDIPSPRFYPHDSHYLVAVGSRNRWELLDEFIGSRH